MAQYFASQNPANCILETLDRLCGVLPDRIEDMASEVQARLLAQDVALVVQAALLYQTAPTTVFQAFCGSRLGGNWGQTFGTLGASTDFDAIISRAMPVTVPAARILASGHQAC